MWSTWFHSSSTIFFVVLLYNLHCNPSLCLVGLFAKISIICLYRYAVLVDGEEKKAGSLFTDFEPAFNPPEEIDDPNDSKPEDWVDVARYLSADYATSCHPTPRLDFTSYVMCWIRHCSLADVLSCS